MSALRRFSTLFLAFGLFYILTSLQSSVTLFSSFRAAFQSCVPFLQGSDLLCFRGMAGLASTVAGASPYEVAPVGQHKGTLIFFHGLGDQGEGWCQQLASFNKLGVKVICPNSASRPVTLNMGMSMPAWFDLRGLSPDSPEDVESIQKATDYVHALIRKEISDGVPSSKVIIGGFSMGAALAIHAGLTFDQPLGAVISFSGFLLQRDAVEKITVNKNIPIFLGHGQLDPLVPFAFGQATEARLKQFNSNVQFHGYSMAHSSCEKELEDARALLQKVISK